ncbi:hypothetical protein C6A85_14185, partial [Mycobacterium sp. ITM-2017-0098]
KAEVAARVDFSGVGIDLATAAPSPAAIGAAVDRVREDDRYRATSALAVLRWSLRRGGRHGRRERRASG